MQAKATHDLGNNIKFQHELMAQLQDILLRHSYHFIKFRLAGKVEDTKQATDMVMTVEGKANIAIRVRRPCKYRDFTIRSQSKGGGKTELQKIQAGEGDWYLYAWANGQGKITEWILVDLWELRKSGVLDQKRRDIPNGDGTAFVAIKLDELRKAKALIQGVIDLLGYTYGVERNAVHKPLEMPEHLRKTGTDT